MGELNIAKTAVTDFGEKMTYVGGATNYTTDAIALDYSYGKEVFVDFPKAAEYFGYYKKYGQLKGLSVEIPDDFPCGTIRFVYAVKSLFFLWWIGAVGTSGCHKSIFVYIFG
jgi:hypothetical protein